MACSLFGPSQWYICKIPPQKVFLKSEMFFIVYVFTLKWVDTGWPPSEDFLCLFRPRGKKKWATRGRSGLVSETKSWQVLLKGFTNTVNWSLVKVYLVVKRDTKQWTFLLFRQTRFVNIFLLSKFTHTPITLLAGQGGLPQKGKVASLLMKARAKWNQG